MCRLLALRAAEPFDPIPWIAPFAERCRESKEYQGHGWGVSWWDGKRWERYRSLTPIWEDVPDRLPAASLVLVHARSAFRNEGIVVENNMPFLEDRLAFAFNGELRGVRLSAPGETGAARLFHLLRRFRASSAGDGAGRPGRALTSASNTPDGQSTPDTPPNNQSTPDSTHAALDRLDRVVAARTDYVRALNTVVSDGRDVWVGSRFSEDPDYFTLWRTCLPGWSGGGVVVSSERFELPGIMPAWAPIPNRTTLKLDMEDRCS